MADRDPLHQPGPSSSELVTHIGLLTAPRLSSRLLPFERQLIAELGCTEQEYQDFKNKVYWLARERPAEYAHIPDIENGDFGISLLVSLIVGAVLQGVSYLLTPKPDIPQQKQITNRNLDSIAGRDRFAPTYDFQVGQELSRYGETIPIVFTQQKQVQLNVNGRSDVYYVGGIMISPKLVWSRMYSWGGYQSVALVFLVGQSPLPRGPYGNTTEIAADRAGIYIGQLPLDTFTDSDYRWYYYQGATPVDGTTTYKDTSRGTTDSRLRGRDNVYGTFWRSETSDENSFSAQQLAGLSSEAFTHSFSPSSQTQFGVYNGLPNGTPYRLNFEVVSIPDAASATSKKSGTAKRFQIAGNPFLDGTGRNYARQFGIVAHNDVEYPAPTQSNGTKRQVNIGDTIRIIFNAGKLQKELYYDTKHPNIGTTIKGAFTYLIPDEDVVDNTQIITAIQSEHEQQDDLLKIGTKWMVGNCLFQVISRNPSDEVFDKTISDPFTIILKCVAVYSDGNSGYVGICDRTFITSSTNLPEGVNGPLYDIAESWFPICKTEIATFQNTRRCQVTEIGLKSNVWVRFNGICNFNSVPDVQKLRQYDDEDVSLTTGTNQSYSRRCSFFHLYARPANNTFGPEEGWAKLNPYPFCVVGSSPQDQYNYIRVGHPYEQFEYRLRPISSGEIVHIIKKSQEITVEGTTVIGPCIRFKVDGTPTGAPEKVYRNTDIQTPYGTFTLVTRGFIDSINTLATHTEMLGAPYEPVKVTSQPKFANSVRFVKAVIRSTGADATVREISNGLTILLNKDPDTVNEVPPAPNIPHYNIRVGAEYVLTPFEATTKFYGTIGQLKIPVRLRLRVENLGPASATATRKIFWSIVNGEYIPVSGPGIQNGKQFKIAAKLFTGADIDYIFETQNVSAAANRPEFDVDQRAFERDSAIAEVSHYNNLISRSCDSSPEHQITYVNESLANDPVRNGTASYTGCAMAGIKLRGSININSFEQLHLYQKNGIQVTNLRLSSAGAVIETVSSSNVFTDLAYYLLTNSHTGTGELISADLVDKYQFARTGSFLTANNLYYDDVIVEPQNLREFLSRIAATLLCNLVTRSGKFSIEPALPIDQNNNYTFFDVKVPIKGIFTEGNIIEDSFQLEYIPTAERLPIRALVRYRSELPNRFPQEQTAVVYYTDQPNGPLEEFNLTYVTSRYHAELFAKYALSARRHRTHGVTFKTLPYGLGLAPGDFIRVVTQAGYTSPAATGIIKSDGTIISTYTFTNNEVVTVYYWDRSNNTVNEASLTVTLRNGQPFATSLFDSIFSIKNTTTNDLVYMVDSLQLDEEGMVEVTASYFPVDADNYSVIANELKPTYTGFTVVADLSPD